MTKRRIWAAVLAVFLYVALASGQVLAKDAGDRKPIIVQGAMNIEIQKMVDALENPKEIVYNGWTFWQGTISGYPVVVSRTEVGMTNAAVATVLGIEKFHPKLIINQGTAGGHDPALNRFDIVVAEKTINYSAFKTKHRDLGQGIELSDWTLMSAQLRPAGTVQKFDGFEGNPALIALARKVSYGHGMLALGVIGTNNQWNRELDFIKMLHDRYGTSVEEMEAASVAQVAQAYSVPFLGIRILSNSEPNNQEFDPVAGQYGQEYTLDVITAIIKSDPAL